MEIQMNFDKELKIRLSEIDHILRSHLPEATGYYKTVIEAMNYSLMGLGKRIRPMLMQETYRLYDKKDDEISFLMV